MLALNLSLNTAPRPHLWLAWINEDAYSTWAPLATRALMQSRLPERAALWTGVSPSQSWNDKNDTHSENIQIHILESLMKAVGHLSPLWNSETEQGERNLKQNTKCRRKSRADQGRSTCSRIFRREPSTPGASAATAARVLQAQLRNNSYGEPLCRWMYNAKPLSSDKTSNPGLTPTAWSSLPTCIYVSHRTSWGHTSSQARPAPPLPRMFYPECESALHFKQHCWDKGSRKTRKRERGVRQAAPHSLGCLWRASVFKDLQKGCIRTWPILQRTRKWKPTPVFLPRESRGQRSLVGCCPQGCTESDTTEAT